MSGRCLGLVGGLGVGATVHYYQELVKAHAARERVAQLLIVHADMTLVLQCARNREMARLAAYFSQLIGRLAEGGADVAAISSITPHICAPELVKISPLPLVNLVEEVSREIHRRGITRVALFGTRFTMESRMFGQLEGVDVAMPRPDEIDLIHNTYFEIVGDGRGSGEQFQLLSRMARTLIERDGAEAIVFAGTELSLLFNAANTDFPHVDCAALHVDAIMRRLLGNEQNG